MTPAQFERVSRRNSFVGISPFDTRFLAQSCLLLVGGTRTNPRDSPSRCTNDCRSFKMAMLRVLGGGFKMDVVDVR